jgi:hypothetical protein
LNLKIISGGQTGVDRAALDVALELGLTCGGWAPKGRLAEDGSIPAKYPLREMPSPKYSVRTEKNVKEADGTLILTIGPVSGGTALTIKLAKKRNKPFFIFDLAGPRNFKPVLDCLLQNGIQTLNVAGPRESKTPGIHDQTVFFLKQLLKER